MTEKIHYIGYASQPYVTLYCTEEEHYVWDAGRKDLPEGVYATSLGGNTNGVVVYTFTKESATCEQCIKKIKCP